ncbi:unnamed protein product, partial [Didymodactylos carnosus]
KPGATTVSVIDILNCFPDNYDTTNMLRNDFKNWSQQQENEWWILLFQQISIAIANIEQKGSKMNLIWMDLIYLRKNIEELKRLLQNELYNSILIPIKNNTLHSAQNVTILTILGRHISKYLHPLNEKTIIFPYPLDDEDDILQDTLK